MRLLKIWSVAIAAAMTSGWTLGQSESDREVTWTGDVAAIFQEKCQECHRPNSIAPMPLLTYEEAKLFAPVIRYRVENRVMPPWHVNPQVGIQEFTNDRGLTEAERATILAWVDQGALEGDPAQAPASLEFNDALVWRLENQMGSPPDLVVESEPVCWGQIVLIRVIVYELDRDTMIRRAFLETFTCGEIVSWDV